MAKINTGETGAILNSLRSELQKGIIGQEKFIDGLILAILANGHVLIEGVPGLAKTRAVHQQEPLWMKETMCFLTTLNNLWKMF